MGRIKYDSYSAGDDSARSSGRSREHGPEPSSRPQTGREKYYDWAKKHQSLVDELLAWDFIDQPGAPSSDFLADIKARLEAHEILTKNQLEAAEDALKSWLRKLKSVTGINLDECPYGFEPDLWKLVLLFEELAEKWEISLSSGRPVIYEKLKARIDKSGLLDAPEWIFKDSKGVVRPWPDYVEAMIREYWTMTFEQKLCGAILPWDKGAADEFTSFEVFRHMSQTIRNRAKGKRYQAELEAKKALEGDKKPQYMRRRDPGKRTTRRVKQQEPDSNKVVRTTRRSRQARAEKGDE